MPCHRFFRWRLITVLKTLFKTVASQNLQNFKKCLCTLPLRIHCFSKNLIIPNYCSFKWQDSKTNTVRADILSHTLKATSKKLYTCQAKIIKNIMKMPLEVLVHPPPPPPPPPLPSTFLWALAYLLLIPG